MPIVRVPDGREVRFPDDMPKTEIKKIIAAKFPDAFADASKQNNEPDNPLLRYPALAGQGAANAAISYANMANEANKINRGLLGFDKNKISQLPGGEAANEILKRLEIPEVKKILPRNAAERATELGARRAVEALPFGAAAILPSAAGGALRGAVNPSNEVAGVALELMGAGSAGGLGGALRKPAAQMLKGGLENAVDNPDALRVLRRGAKADDAVAESVIREATGAADNINNSSADVLDRILNGVDPRARYKDVRKSYQQFVNANKGKKVKGAWDKLRQLNPFQQEKYEKSLNEGLKKADYGTREGDLGHLLSARQEIDDAINRSFIQEFPGKKATHETQLLSELREKLDEYLRKGSSVKGADRMFELYKQFQDAYESGLKFTPGARKNVINDFMLNAGGDAEKALQARIGMKKGLYDALTTDITPEANFSKNAKKFQNILKKVNYPQDYSEIINKLTKNDRNYSRLAKLTNDAERKLTVPEASKLFAREQFESTGSMTGAALDYVLGRLGRNFYKENAQKLLDNPGGVVEILLEPGWLARPKNAIKGSAAAAARQAVIDALSQYEGK